MKLWDTSAIIPLGLQEQRTALLKKNPEEDGAIAGWWATPIERYSAFARPRRENVLSSAEEDQARQVVLALAAEWTQVEPSLAVRENAARAILLHPLRAADSLQLAAALVWANGHGAGHRSCASTNGCEKRLGEKGFLYYPNRRDLSDQSCGPVDG